MVEMIVSTRIMVGTEIFPNYFMIVADQPDQEDACCKPVRIERRYTSKHEFKGRIAFFYSSIFHSSFMTVIFNRRLHAISKHTFTLRGLIFISIFNETVHMQVHTRDFLRVREAVAGV